MSIRLKLIITFMALALIPSFLIGILAFTNYKRSLETNKLYELKNIAAFKADKIETYFNYLKTELRVVQNSYVIKNNLHTLVQLSDSPTNPTFIAAKKRVDEILKKTQPVLELSNIILTDTKGKIIYFSNHKHSSRDIYDVFSKIDFKPEKDKVYFSDVFLNEGQEKKLALFIAVPAFDANGTYSGTVVFDSDVSPIYKLIQDATGLGNTGEMLVGKKIENKAVFLNTPRHTSGSLSRDMSVILGESRAQEIQKAVNGETGVGQLIDYRGEKVVAAWQPLSSIDWGIVAKMDAKEAFAAVTNLRSVLIVTMIIISILSWVMAVSISESISAPIKKLSKGADIIGSGNLDYNVIIDQKDEIGSLSQSLTRMTRNLKDMTASRDELDREINNRKLVEQHLRQSEIKYRGLIELSPEAILVNQDNSVVLVNKSALDLFGAHSSEQILGKSLFELFHSDSHEIMSGRINNLLLKGEKVPVIEEKIIRMDGDVRDVEITVAPLTNEDRPAIQVILHDITERKNIENALIQSKMEWIETFNTIPDLIAIMDNQHRIVRVNKAMAEKLGMSPSDLEGLHCYEFIHGTKEPPLFCPHRALLNDGKEHEVEIHEMKLGGDFLISVTPILDKNGVVKGALHVAHDITARKKAEEILKRDKESLEKLVKAGSIELAETQIRLERTKRLSDIGALAATVAHELRNPLAAINISSAIIKRKTKDENITRYLSNIEKSVTESDQIINNLLYYSRIKPPYLEDVNVYNIIDECIGNIKTKTKKTISIKKDVSLLKDISITADPLQIKEVFNNILNNAYDAVPEKKGKIELTSSYNGKFVKILIKDNGVGIDKGDIERVFNPFFTTKAKGTGLGLSVCKQIVNMHGGTIDIQSNVDNGTTVSISLPKKKKNRGTSNA